MWPRIHCAWSASCGSSGNAESQVSRACKSSPRSSCAFAAAEILTSCSLCKSVWHCGQTIAPRDSGAPQLWQLRNGSTGNDEELTLERMPYTADVGKVPADEARNGPKISSFVP